MSKDSNDPVLRKFSVLKGRLAEGLADELLTMLGFAVTRVGVEHILPAGALRAVRAARDRREARPTSIRAVETMPDFWIESPERGIEEYVEVKFRSEPRLSRSALEGCPYLAEHNGILLLFCPTTGSENEPHGFVRACRHTDAIAWLEDGGRLDIGKVPTLVERDLFGDLSEGDRANVAAIAKLSHEVFSRLPNHTQLPTGGGDRNRARASSPHAAGAALVGNRDGSTPWRNT